MSTSQETLAFLDQLGEHTALLQGHLETISNYSTQFEGWYRGSSLSCRHIVRRIETLQQTIQALAALLKASRWSFDIQIGFDLQNSLPSLDEQGDEVCIVIMVYSNGCTSLTETALRQRKDVRIRLQQFIRQTQKLIDRLTPLLPAENVTVVESIPLQVSTHSSSQQEVHDAME